MAHFKLKFGVNTREIEKNMMMNESVKTCKNALQVFTYK